MMLDRRQFLAGSPAVLPGPGPLFTFAAIADVQYADQPARNGRDYRGSLAKLTQAAELLRGEACAFTVHLGDLVDGGEQNLERVLPLLELLPQPVHHVTGNHDAPREAWLNRLGITSPYRRFTRGDWVFFLLDGMAVRAGDGGVGDRVLKELVRRKEPNAQDWNGGLGADQREWLQQGLAQAYAEGKRAGVFCHFPVVPYQARADHLLWDWRQTQAVLRRSPALSFWMNGHDHRGGRARVGGVDYMTLRGMVETEPIDAVAVVEVHQDGVAFRRARRL